MKEELPDEKPWLPNRDDFALQKRRAEWITCAFCYRYVSPLPSVFLYTLHSCDQKITGEIPMCPISSFSTYTS
jgi:hypothetical protein